MGLIPKYGATVYARIGNRTTVAHWLGFGERRGSHAVYDLRHDEPYDAECIWRTLEEYLVLRKTGKIVLAWDR